MYMQNPRLYKRAMPQEDRAFYKEMLASVAVATAIVLIV